jgi:hypothetical protein
MEREPTDLFHGTALHDLEELLLDLGDLLLRVDGGVPSLGVLPLDDVGGWRCDPAQVRETIGCASSSLVEVDDKFLDTEGSVRRTETWKNTCPISPLL